MSSHLSDIQRILKNGQESYLFSGHYRQHFQSTISCTDLYKCMELKGFIYINPIG